MPTLDGLQALVEKYLLVREGARLHMLEAIREFALERLEASGDAAELRRRHAGFYLAHAEQMDADVRLVPFRLRRARLAPERANSLAALEHFRREQDHASEARLAAATLWIDWAWSPKEGSRWLGRVLTYHDLPTPVRARVVWAASRIARNRGDHALDAELSAELVHLWRSLDDKQLTVRTLARLAIASTLLGDADRARAALDEAQSIARELGTDIASAMAEMAEAAVALYSDRHKEARAACERALDRFRRAEAPLGITSILTYLGWIGLAQRRHNEAAHSFRESLVTRQGADVLWTADGDLDGLAAVATARGEPSVAAVLLGAAEAARYEGEAGDDPVQARLRAETLAAVRESLDVDAYGSAVAEGRAMTIEAAVEYALASVD